MKLWVEIWSFLFGTYKNEKSRIAPGFFYSKKLIIIHYQLSIKLFNEFNLLRFFSIHAIKKALFVHPFVAEYFAHVS